MKLTQLLIKVGLLHGPSDPESTAPAPAEAPPTPVFEKRILKLEELRAQSGEAREKQEERDLGLGLTFQDIYQVAGIEATPKGLSLSELHALVAGKPEAEARQLLEKAIRDKGADLNEVLLDAQQRDAALDKYEEVLGSRFGRWEADTRRRADSMREQAQHLLKQAREAEERIEELRAKVEEWRKSKHAAEDEVEHLARLLLKKENG